MKVVHINTLATSGAAIAALRLHQGLLDLGVDSSFLTLGNADKRTKVVTVYRPLSYLARVLNRLGLPLTVEQKNAAKIRAGGDYEIFTFPTSSIDLANHPLVKSADIIHLHWVANFLDYPTFFRTINKPIVWTLHDMNPFQGGFHYQADMDRNKNTSLRRLDRKLVLQKQQAIQACENLHVVSPSQWLMEASQRSEILGRFPHYHIPYGMDTSSYKPYEQQLARDVFKLPLNKRLLLFVSDHVSNKRKGFDLLETAIHGSSWEDDIVFCAVGHSDGQSFSDKIIHLGHISDDRLMPLLYSAVDAVIIPSREDNLPNVMIEALACGTPVIGFPIGGIKEVVGSDDIGVLSKEVGAKALSLAIQAFLDRSDKFDRQFIREFGERSFGLLRQGQRYIDLYEALLK
ncbi:MAG: glycosyltransferase [Saprospiraceae bacterium]|nr:glycosyltransferase [Saprospiraceae bacterium]